MSRCRFTPSPWPGVALCSNFFGSGAYPNRSGHRGHGVACDRYSRQSRGSHHGSNTAAAIDQINGAFKAPSNATMQSKLGNAANVEGNFASLGISAAGALAALKNIPGGGFYGGPPGALIGAAITAAQNLLNDPWANTREARDTSQIFSRHSIRPEISMNKIART